MYPNSSSDRLAYDIANWLPVVGTALDIGEAVEVPTQKNIANAGISVLADIFASKLFKSGLYELKKGFPKGDLSKAVANMSQAMTLEGLSKTGLGKE